MAAFRYAGSGEHPPPGLATLSYIDRFGVKAVLGKDVLSYGEIQRMLTEENIVKAFSSRKASGDWAKWAQENPQDEKLLTQAEILANATD